MNGTLEDTTPAGVLQVLSSQHSSGAVRFLGDSGCTVYLNRGELYFAESTETAEDLAVALVRPGRLTAEQWDASTDAGYPTETVGEELIATGGIDRELLASVVLSIIYDPLIKLFRAPEGDYEFTPDLAHWIGPYRTFSVDAIVSEVRRRTREADEMAPVVPSLDAIVRSARTLPESHGSVNLRRDDWEVVVAASSGCTVSELAVELGRGRWSTARIVYRLATADLVMVTAASDDDRFSAVGSGSSDTVAPITPLPDFGFGADDAPPPLDTSAFSDPSDGIAVVDPDPWRLDEPVVAPDSDSTWESPDQDVAKPADDPWGEFDATATETEAWDPSALYGDAPDEDTVEGASAPEAEPDSVWGSGLSAVPDIDVPDSVGEASDAGDAPEPPALHPDIAKALAESTYADSATAINAMAARLGAIDSDDDDDWDTGDGESDDDFWAEGDSGTAADEFIWKPAAWDTGVESTPLPQRASTRTAAAPTGDSTSDPAWLDSLYSEFMPTGEPKSGAGLDGASAPDPDAAPKQRGLRRLMSAIRRL